MPCCKIFVKIDQGISAAEFCEIIIASANRHIFRSPLSWFQSSPEKYCYRIEVSKTIFPKIRNPESTINHVSKNGFMDTWIIQMISLVSYRVLSEDSASSPMIETSADVTVWESLVYQQRRRSQNRRWWSFRLTGWRSVGPRKFYHNHRI